MQDGVYIEYLMEQRIMRRTNIMDELHKIYAGKYERWIRQYLISKQILEAPLFIFCNSFSNSTIFDRFWNIGCRSILYT